MEVKLKLSEILSLNQSLKSIIDDVNLQVDSLFKFKLLGIMKVIEPHISNLEIVRNELINKYGEKTDDGHVQISKENIEVFDKFSSEIKKIIESIVSVNFEPLSTDDVFNKGVPAEYLVGLYPVIKEK